MVESIKSIYNFGNLGEPFDGSSASARYQQSVAIPSNKLSQRTTEQSSRISPATRPTDQPVINQQQLQQRLIPTQIQQPPSMTIKPVVTPQYTVHQQQHQMNTPNILLQTLLYHHQQQQHQQPEVTSN